MEIPVRSRAEQAYILRAWALIYEHLLQASRLEAARRSLTAEQTNDA